MSFERYVDYALDVPMYFLMRDGKFVNTAGESFREFLAGRLPQLPGEKPVLKDWADHLTTIFPEVRLKRYLEMRGADAGPVPMLDALPALWVGLLYDDRALDEAEQLVRDWSAAERQAMRDHVPKRALATPFRGATLRDLAREVLAIARGGLARRARRDDQGRDETLYLEPLDVIVAEGRTAAENLLAAHHNLWSGSVEPVFQQNAY